MVGIFALKILTSDQMRPAVATKSSMVAEAFLPRAKSEGESWLQSLLASWWEGGVEGLLQTSESPLCLQLLKLWRLSWSFYPSLYPHLRLTNQQLIQEFSSSHSWQGSPLSTSEYFCEKASFRAEVSENSRSREFSTRVSFIFSRSTTRNEFLKYQSRLET